MKIKTAATIRTILLIVAFCMLYSGYTLARATEKAAASDMSRISVQVTAKECRYDTDRGRYCIDLTYKFKNRTKVAWTYLASSTLVSDKSGKSLGTVTSQFGATYGASDFKLEVGDSTTKTTTIESANPNDFIVALLESDLSDLTFTTELTDGRYIEK